MFNHMFKGCSRRITLKSASQLQDNTGVLLKSQSLLSSSHRKDFSHRGLNVILSYNFGETIEIVSMSVHVHKRERERERERERFYMNCMYDISYWCQ